MKTLRNHQHVDEILSRLDLVTPASPRLWGKMSAHQMICHLNDAFKLYTGVIAAASPGFPYPSKLLKWGSLWVPLRWPKGFRTPRELDQQHGGTRPVEFERDVTELRSLVTRFSQIPESFHWPAHPYLGRMSVREWMRLGYLHTDHHLRQFGV